MHTRQSLMCWRRSRGRMAVAACACLLVGASGCEKKEPLPTFHVTFTASSDGKPLAGVRFVGEGAGTFGVTDRTGRLNVTLRGKEGSSLSVRATCPSGYREADPLPPLTLRRFRKLDPGTPKRGLEMSVSCRPTKRKLAVLIKAEGQPALPVMQDGRQVQTTDEGGVAHLLFELAPGSTFRLELDTSDHPELRPQNPGKTFTVADEDAIVAYDQPFEVHKKHHRHHHRAPPPPPPAGPIRLH